MKLHVMLHPHFNRIVARITNNGLNYALFGFIQPSVGRWQISKLYIKSQLMSKPADRKQIKGAKE